GSRTEVFVSKLSPGGRTLLYSTILGGESFDDGVAIAVTSGGVAFVGGYTESKTFFLLNSLQPALPGARDGFVVGLESDGLPFFSTYVSGRRGERLDLLQSAEAI